MTSMFFEAFRAQIEPTLVCPACAASNDPKIRHVKLEDRDSASCSHCGHGGPIHTFQPKEYQ